MNGYSSDSVNKGCTAQPLYHREQVEVNQQILPQMLLITILIQDGQTLALFLDTDSSR